MGCCFIMYDDMNHCLNIIPSESRPFFQYYPYVIPSVWCIFRLCACLCNEMKKLFKILSPLKLCNQPRKNLKMILSLLKNEYFKKSPQKLIIYSFPLIPSVSASVTTELLTTTTETVTTSKVTNMSNMFYNCAGAAFFSILHLTIAPVCRII